MPAYPRLVDGDPAGTREGELFRGERGQQLGSGQPGIEPDALGLLQWQREQRSLTADHLLRHFVAFDHHFQRGRVDEQVRVEQFVAPFLVELDVSARPVGFAFHPGLFLDRFDQQLLADSAGSQRTLTRLGRPGKRRVLNKLLDLDVKGQTCVLDFLVGGGLEQCFGDYCFSIGVGVCCGAVDDRQFADRDVVGPVTGTPFVNRHLSFDGSRAD